MREDNEQILKYHNRKVNEMAQMINEGNKMKKDMERQLPNEKKIHGNRGIQRYAEPRF